jgi:hypothetical protein
MMTQFAHHPLAVYGALGGMVENMNFPKAKKDLPSYGIHLCAHITLIVDGYRSIVNPFFRITSSIAIMHSRSQHSARSEAVANAGGHDYGDRCGREDFNLWEDSLKGAPLLLFESNRELAELNLVRAQSAVPYTRHDP